MGERRRPGFGGVLMVWVGAALGSSVLGATVSLSFPICTLGRKMGLPCFCTAFQDTQQHSNGNNNDDDDDARMCMSACCVSGIAPFVQRF